MIGRELGHFKITDRLGEGGMGEVYRAQDTKLGRDVALKILPERFMEDPERLARFKREARVLASLSHPNIAGIHEVGDEGDLHYLVMELVEGETLAERIARGPLPPREALPIALEIAHAVEAAHARGIVHRDLKPANIKIAPGDTVKVLDFGLAKALEPEPGSRGATSLANSPTLTNQDTQAGMLMGTAAYMSPEQARGREADRRVDIWALGVILFEMLTGRAVFAGDTVSDTLASVLRSEAEWGRLPADVHPEIRRLLERCLEKDSDRRLHDVADARVVLADAVAGRLPQPPTPDAVGETLPSRWRRGAWTAAAVLTGAVLTAIVGWLALPPRSAPPLRKTELAVSSGGIVPRISPDGLRVAYGDEDGIRIRDLRKLGAIEIPGSEDADLAFWSPDSRWLAFSVGKKLLKCPVDGGGPVTIARLPERIRSGGGGAWMPDGRIIFATGGSGLLEVSERGGDPRSLLDPADGEDDFHDVTPLPDDLGAIFVVHRKEGIDTIDLLVDGKRTRVLQLPGEMLGFPVYSPTGHVLYNRYTTTPGLWALPFSLKTLEATGEPFLVDGKGSFPSVSQEGTLLFMSFGEESESRIVWVDRSGQVQGEITEPGRRVPGALSPDGKRLVYVTEDEQRDLWIVDLDRQSNSRLTFDDEREIWPEWSPDGREIVYAVASQGDEPRMFAIAADGRGSARSLGNGNVPTYTPDGRGIVYTKSEDIWLLAPLDGEPTLLVEAKESQFFAQVSPAGGYLAYTSGETGRQEVYLTGFPEPTGKWQVSKVGGTRIRWSSDGSRLYYLQRVGDGQALMEVDVATEPSLALGQPKQLFVWPSGGIWNYIPAPDGKRFIVTHADEETAASVLVVVQNWFEEFRDQP